MTSRLIRNSIIVSCSTQLYSKYFYLQILILNCISCSYFCTFKLYNYVFLRIFSCTFEREVWFPSKKAMNDLFFVLPFLGIYCFWGHIDQIIPQLCRKRRTLKIEQELISNKHQCSAAALFSQSCLDGRKRSISLDYSSLGERGRGRSARSLCAG